MLRSLVGSEMCIRDRYNNAQHIIPSHVLSQIDIQSLKTKYEVLIDSIKNTRNYLAHYSFKKAMPKPEFDARWIIIRNTLVAMGYNQIKLFDDLENQSLDPYLDSKVQVIVDTFKVLDDDKCNKKDFEDLKTMVLSLLKEVKEIKDEISKNKRMYICHYFYYLFFLK